MLFNLRENQCEIEASGSVSVPVHTLPSTYLQKVPEQPEDADNQKNVTRMIQPPLDKTTTVNIPVTITAPPGETTVIPSECLCPPAFCYEIARKELTFQGASVTHWVMGALLATSTLAVGGQENLLLIWALQFTQPAGTQNGFLGYLVALENTT